MQFIPSIILHIDFDYFYAQVEEIARSEAKGKAIVVCMFSGRTENSGAVATSNYKARKFGVRSGMPIIRARQLLEGQDALFVPANHRLYSEVSYNSMEILQNYADKFEPASIDEAFLDISKSCNSFENAKQVAEKIKKEILEKIGLTCSIGIGANKLVAKIASDFLKPDGLTIIRPDEVDKFLAPMAVDKIPGIGKKTSEFLASYSITTIRDLKNADPGLLLEKFGKNTGAWLIRAAQGQDDSEVGITHEQKQISRISTLKHNSRDFGEFSQDVEYLIADIVRELKERELLCETIGIIAIDGEMQALSRSYTLQHATDSLEEIKKTVNGLYAELCKSLKKDLRRVGVKVEKLQSKAGQKTLSEF